MEYVHGPTCNDTAIATTVNGAGNIYITGSNDAKWGNPLDSITGGTDAFAAKLDSDGTRTWNTFMGSMSYETGDSIAVDGSGNATVVGTTSALWGNPLINFAGGLDDFVAQIGVPYLEIKGKGQDILSGDTSPSTTDGTDFGSHPLTTNASQIFTLQNSGASGLSLDGVPKIVISGAQASDFSVSVQPTSPVAAGGSTTFTVTFAPSATGLRQATVSIASNAAEAPYTFTIQGTGVSPVMELQGKDLSIASGDATPTTEDGTDFGNLQLTASESQTFTIQNSGTFGLHLSGTPMILISGPQAADFTISAQPTSPIAPAGSTTFTITFTPSAAGLRQATVSIANNSLINPYTFTIQGTGMRPPMQYIFLPHITR